MIKNFVLIGNQNSGKTTLFNKLTGSNQKVGNWAGVTVEKKEGKYRKDKSIAITDLPGLYSLSFDTIDERVVVDYIKNNEISALINVVDGTNLYRSLKLTLELKKLGIPMVVAINMADELEKKGIEIDFDELSKRLKAPVVSISAIKNKNLEELVKTTKEQSNKKVGDSLYSDFESVEKLLEGCYNYIEQKTITERIDGVLLNKFLGFPIFFAVIFLIYFASINLGGFLGEKIADFFSYLSIITAKNLQKIDTPNFLINLICGAIFNGVGSVVSFLPQVLVLFLFMSILEESGYMARVAFLFDRLFNAVGLSGKSVIPLILSSGCAVTGVMSTKTIETDGERKATLFLAPFMPCSAKLAVFSYLSQILFSGSAIIAVSLYFLSIFSVIIGGVILKKLKIFKKGEDMFVLDMPTFRFPSLRNVYYTLLEKTKDFLFKAGTVIFAVSVIVWGLTNFGFCGYVNGKIEKSFLRVLGGSFEHLFYPLGINGWQIPVSIISSIFAKEAVIETLTYLAIDFSSCFYSPFSAYAFLTFILLSPPCMATLVACKRELKDKKSFLKMLLFQFAFAYIISFLINVIGIIYYKGLLTTAIILVIIIVTTVRVVMYSFKYKCKSCKNCSKCKRRKNER